MSDLARLPLPMRPTGPACPLDREHGPMTLGRDGAWHCYNAAHDGYPGFVGRWGATQSSTVKARPATRSVWPRDGQ